MPAHIAVDPRRPVGDEGHKDQVAQGVKGLYGKAAGDRLGVDGSRVVREPGELDQGDEGRADHIGAKKKAGGPARHAQDRPAFGFQGHPEASPGPHDLLPLFERFIQSMEAQKRAGLKAILSK